MRMKTRTIAVASRIALICLLSFASSPAAGEEPRGREIAITMDDLDVNADDTPLLSLEQRNEAILAALEQERLQAAMFICGMRVDNPQGKKHVLTGSRAGHLLGNHSYSHWYFPRSDFETFSADVLRGQKVIEEFPQFRKLFRFPYLKEGATPEQRDRMRSFLESQGYRNGYVTIDNSDWAIDQRMRSKLKLNPKADLEPYRKFYLEHVWTRALYYDRLAVDVLGRPVKHTLLIHHNLLNALFLDDLLDMFKSKGWKLVNVEKALTDPIFGLKPDIAPAGESIVWAVAKETKKFDALLRYPAEDGRVRRAANE